MEAAKVGLPGTEVDKFIAYYGANGWKVGKNTMKSWPHALAGWAARWRERDGQPNAYGRPQRPHRNDSIAGADDVARRAEAEAADGGEADELPFGTR